MVRSKINPRNRRTKSQTKAHKQKPTNKSPQTKAHKQKPTNKSPLFTTAGPRRNRERHRANDFGEEMGAATQVIMDYSRRVIHRFSQRFWRLRSRFYAVQAEFEAAETLKDRQRLLALSKEILSAADRERQKFHKRFVVRSAEIQDFSDAVVASRTEVDICRADCLEK
jgi:hypothetical protein